MTHTIRAAAIATTLALGLVLTGCTATDEPDSTTAATTAGTVSECAEVQAGIASMSTTAEGIQDKIPGDIPGALADLQSIQTELTTLGDTVQDTELKGYVDEASSSVVALTDLLTRASNGEVSEVDAITQGLAEYDDLTTAIDDVKTYCGA